MEQGSLRLLRSRTSRSKLLAVRCLSNGHSCKHGARFTGLSHRISALLRSNNSACLPSVGNFAVSCRSTFYSSMDKVPGTAAWIRCNWIIRKISLLCRMSVILVCGFTRQPGQVICAGDCRVKRDRFGQNCRRRTNTYYCLAEGVQMAFSRIEAGGATPVSGTDELTRRDSESIPLKTCRDLQENHLWTQQIFRS